jgi:hypothetical protein
MTQGEELGKPRRLGAAGMSGEGRASASTAGAGGLGMVFGAPSAREPEPCVGEILRGWYTPEEQGPDADLGKSIREGWRNTEPCARVSGARDWA